MPEYLSVQEIAAELNLDPESVRIHCRNGNLPALKAGKGWRVRRETLDEWLASPTRAIVQKSVTAKALLRTILRMSPEELELAVNMLDAARSLYGLNQHTTDEEAS